MYLYEFTSVAYKRCEILEQRSRVQVIPIAGGIRHSESKQLRLIITFL